MRQAVCVPHATRSAARARESLSLRPAPFYQAALDRLGFVATPHFFLLKADGTPVAQMRGVVPRDSLARALDRLRAAN